MIEPSTVRRPRAERGDYRANHARLIRAAFAAFDETGVDTPLAAVAQRAGVGEATLYRHFASREDLVAEMYEVGAAAIEQAAIEALAAPHPDVAARLDAFFEAMVGAISTHRCYAQLAPRGSRLRPDREVDPRGVTLMRALVAEAQDAGLLAPDVIGTDLTTLALTAGTLAADSTPESDIGWQRHLAIGRRGLAPAGGPGEPAAIDLPAVPGRQRQPTMARVHGWT
ncbi:TetR/AcrR family transcriptional regulator [Demequina sp. SYSU T00192]|uniref:TetR/AcrR family transcriptional regulator n=1 Tax=Demequina litoralis TaxID=3051660 RepID=A0ABT8G6L6_9MICO|nr:TetR/AcrR family transcriptional regulator [Demequina sp. SYSU T00192]MDN4474783.1 TetR/AcrR family transcriptional regulator [Demequina sp. SYSU T00192]